ncbi:MAG: metallophosphoesterase [Bacilli bacterium]|nr:metallophosphoesterase [Bacilli bacterium]
MKKSIFLFPSLLALCVTACAGVKQYEPKDYMLDLNVTHTGDIRVLQLTDTHIGDKDNVPLHEKFMDLTINEAKANGGLDLIVITGDVFTFASKSTAKQFLDWVDSHEIPWTLTFGNHDEQCWFSIDWLTDVLNNYGPRCLFLDKQDDTIQGNANFAINCYKNNTLFEQFILMDSNRYNYKGYFGYDYFKQDQIDWYSRLVEHTKVMNSNTVLPSLMFYHIPLPEVRDAWEAAKNDSSLILNPVGEGQQNEEPCNPDYNSHFYDVIKEKGSTHGMYFGHDHINNYIINYDGIHFGYGIKATDRVYADDSMLGGRVIVIHDDHSLDYEDIYHTYQEVK